MLNLVRRPRPLWRQLSKQSVVAGVSTGLQHMSTTSPADIEATLRRRLEGNVAIITGAAGSIGSATSKLFVAHGAKVVLADLNEDAGQKLAQDIGPGAVFKRTDVTSEQNIESTVEFAIKEFGKLDIMFNNAGVTTNVDTMQDLDMEEYDRHTAVMVRGVVCGIKHAARAMISNKRGVILNTASTASVSVGNTMPLVYNINKMNIPGLTKVASWHLARHGIRVNSISPHAIPSGLVLDWVRLMGLVTDFVTLKAAFAACSPLPNRHCTDQDIANGALFLCSDESSYVSGHNLVVDAGFCNKVDYDPLQLGDPFKKLEEQQHTS